MSFSFYVKLADEPDKTDIEEEIADPRWRCDDSDGDIWHPFLAGAGSRGVELSYEDGTFQIRIMACSSRGDHELALAILRYVAKDGETIAPEDGEPCTVATLDKHFGGDWIDRMVGSGVDYVIELARKGQTVTLGGARRPFHFGPRTLARLEAMGGDLGDRLRDAMIAAQIVDEDDAYYAAQVMSVEAKDAKETFTLAVWAEGVRYVFPDVERFAVLGDDGSSFMIPSAAGPEVAGSDWRWLDEKQGIVEAKEGAAWKAFVAAARARAIPGTD